MHRNENHLTFLLITLYACVTPILGISTEEEMQQLTTFQKYFFDRFKERVIEKLPEEYMRQDFYLLRFLRAKYFSVSRAEEAILANLDWRELNNMSSILQEDFSDIDQDHKLHTDSVDLEGQPTGVIDTDVWDVRRTIIAGNVKRLLRYFTSSIELMVTKARKSNVTQWNLIVDMNNYNVMQHACLRCLPVYVHLTNVYERYYPGSANKIFLLNTPPAFEAVLSVLRPLMSPLTRDALKIYGHDREIWQSVLFQFISREEVPSTLGGTKVYD